MEATELEMDRRKTERLANNARVKEYWRGRRVDIQLEAVRDRITALNISNEWVDVEMMDHEEMDKMMDVTGAVVDMEESNLSLSKEEHWMDELMLSVMDRPEVMEATLNSGNIGYIGGGFNDVSEVEEWQDDTFFQGLSFEDWVEQEMEALDVSMDVGPEQVLVSGQENVALGLEIINPESYATPMKTKPQLEHEMWGITLPSMNFQIEDFGPTMCSTPSQKMNEVLARRGARTPPTLPRMPNPEQVPNPGLAFPTTSPTPTLAGTIDKHTAGFSDIKNPVNGNGGAPCRNLGLANSPLTNSSRKPKPWHVAKKRGIIPDGLVQARLSHFRLLTNQGRGQLNESKLCSDSTNGKTGKRKAGILDSPNAIRQRRN